MNEISWIHLRTPMNDVLQSKQDLEDTNLQQKERNHTLIKLIESKNIIKKLSKNRTQ